MGTKAGGAGAVHDVNSCHVEAWRVFHLHLPLPLPPLCFSAPLKKYEIYHVARTMKTFYKLKRISVERRRMKNMIQQMVQRRMPERQDGPGSVCIACQLQVLHAPHSGASDAAQECT